MRDRTPFDEALIPMSVGELNHLMTYVTEAWMLFSLGFVSIGFVSFVSRRIQEDIEAEAVAINAAQANVQTDEVSVIEAVDSAINQANPQTISAVVVAPEVAAPEFATPTAPENSPSGDQHPSEETEVESLTEDDAARIEKVTAVSEQLAKNKAKQADSSSVSVST